MDFTGPVYPSFLMMENWHNFFEITMVGLIKVLVGGDALVAVPIGEMSLRSLNLVGVVVTM